LFYHGYTNYLAHAFPEDELKPISCKPQTRNRDDPADIGLNDVLGNYSVTLIDSLSTLAILASDDDERHAKKALRDFQTGIKSLVELYGDGTEKGRCGSRACGFDLDSKVQVFETNIRGVGGLLSAHLFAVGELPIRGYAPRWETDKKGRRTGIIWKGFKYNDQLLHLAYDLASRLLPAFSTTTGLPYPRVNLRHGIPFYQDAEEGVCRLDGTSSNPRDITETCAAGAGSLVLEFTTLSRLTGNDRFESLAKRAFWAIWERRSAIGLIGGGIDAENGQWTMPPLAGVGAGIDSFFEYALKSHVLLSGVTHDQNVSTDGPDAFLSAWDEAHTAVKRHIYRSPSTEKHPYYGQADLITGAPRYSWIDNLSAYYPGLLVLAGEMEEAIESHLLFAALWTRYSALPERWHAFNSFIDPNFKHWAGRPEFIESTYYIYQATKDPWYLHVGEMTLRDIRRRCWTKCGWADLGDVLTGEQRDRMESFFLGETAKYLYLLFSEGHPLNKGDAPWVFTTEGHPLIIPKSSKTASRTHAQTSSGEKQTSRRAMREAPPVCPAPPAPVPLTISHATSRTDLFHAAALAQLHLVPVNPTQSSPLEESSSTSGPGVSLADVRGPTNYTFYPWTLPADLIPPKGISASLRSPVTSTLTFPNLVPGVGEAEKGLIPLGALQKVIDGVLINSLSNLRLNMVQEPKSLLLPPEAHGNRDSHAEYRIYGIANWALGRDEKVLLSADALQGVSPVDPHFTRVKDLEMVDLIVDLPVQMLVDNEDGVDEAENERGEMAHDQRDMDSSMNGSVDSLRDEVEDLFANLLSGSGLKALDSTHNLASKPTGRLQTQLTRTAIPAILATGVGAAPLPPSIDRSSTSTDPATLPIGQLPFHTIFFLDDTLCSRRLPTHIAKTHNILIVKRGECSFNDKLANIPSFAPSTDSLQLVIMLSVPEAKGEAEWMKPTGELIRPLLDLPQMTPNGIERRHGIAMVMVDGDADTVAGLRAAAETVGVLDRDGRVQQEARYGTEGDAGERAGLAVKRRYWFESMGVPIGNLIML